ncbi:uncharacterized protein TRIVIDRAFT_39899 [Trichoderma virens Gv29-8]|uniref:MARVEL domain-containing protein n=1 Tax=Hypocrea virens (strain Gv29-8 / FGSC 10586) TaxID=413071 RepID=G9NAZ4_HYPVG|nr:uncharacterized protein TRIVIDRAFT_39899 [Trichoderma virens Gv29-8]EHK16004.1 hypothetical protein TRIVIDRAFT_39899 [Trichoderma virens Gv29-8]UKZ56224.1 hypothetical protein TrVGV298_010057 [Trichoderma virens]
MSQTLIIWFRAVQGLMAAASIALAAYVVNWHLRGSHLSTPPSINFLLFCPIFTVSSILYLEFTPRFAPKAVHPMVSLIIEAINCIFYFAGFIAVAVCLGDLAFCDGSVCMAGRGTAVLAAAQFSLWMGSAIIAAKAIFKDGRQMKLLSRSRSARDLEI